MSYILKVSYQTGDTDKYHDTYSEVDLGWENKDAAKAALKRIVAHYHWFKHCGRDGRHCWLHYGRKCPPRPDFILGDKWEDQSTVPLLKDDGTTELVHVDWIGYFESLKAVEVLVKDDPDMKWEA